MQEALKRCQSLISQPGLAHRTVDHPQIRIECDEVAEGHVTLDDQEAAKAERDELQRESQAIEHGMYRRLL